MINPSRNHFELFGLPATFRIDADALDEAYRALQAEVHPDRHAGGSDSDRRLAMQSSTQVNAAYQALKDPVERARYLLALRGIDAFDETDTKLSLDFLEAQLERRERAAEAADVEDVEALDAILAEVRSEIRTGSSSSGVCSTTTWPPTVPRPPCASSASSRKSPRTSTRCSRARLELTMALFQIAEPDAPPPAREPKRAIGIDLGTTNSLVATVRNRIPVVLPDEEGRPLVPSIVRYAERASRSATTRWRTSRAIRRTRSCR